MEPTTNILGPEITYKYFEVYAARLGQFILQRTDDIRDALRTIEANYSTAEYPPATVLFADPRVGIGISIVDTTPAGQTVEDSNSIKKSPRGRIYNVCEGMNGWTYQAYIRQIGGLAATDSLGKPTLLTGEKQMGVHSLVGYVEDQKPRIAAVECRTKEQLAKVCFRPAINMYCG